ncbi:MAG: phosphoribosylamine--glycine ligase [Verrucomicrobiae bacterium]|nr:phosphoribosylamine--glycine ligase [Verrucomicrobiae bacterium]
MKVLVVGKGGREHALITAIAQSPTETEIYSFPGSDAIFELARPTDATDLPSLIAFMQRENVDLCVAGEESYLVTGDGLANCCREAGIPCWGPEKQSAQLEASKEFAKNFMVKHSIPTGSAVATSSPDEARAAITCYPVVLKFDGLAAGKGVVICEDAAQADVFLEEVFVQKRFGDGRVLVEEHLTGPEVSIFVSVVDDAYHILTPARDYKRIGDNDEGPNTGGMGAVASMQLIDSSILDTIERTIVKPTVDALQADGLRYRGFLYFGLMLTPDGPKIIEYNCRFGDPECQAVMPLISGDFAQYVFEGAKGNLVPELIKADGGWSICLILASAGYPASSRSGDVISGLDKVEGARVYHAGTRRNGEGAFESNGGRVLAVVAPGNDRISARDKVYAEAAKIDFPGAQRRSDIGTLHFQ